MGLARYFVVRQSEQWLVTLEGRAMGRHATQSQAVSSAIVMADLMGAMHHDADVMVEDEPGAPLRLVWTYGRDEVTVSAVKVPRTVPSHSHVKRVQIPSSQLQVP